MRSTTLLALAASLSTSLAAHQGFNYGATNSDGSFKYRQNFEDEFNAAKSLVGTSGFTSARLYTMIQGGSSTNEPIQALQAAIDTDTSLLLGLWASGGQGGLDAEISALKSALAQTPDFAKLVVGISVGSEDLYRISPTGIAANSGYGADPATLAAYIGQVRAAIAGTALSAAPIGHVDTWTAWVNGSNKAVVDAVDWVGMDAYPYFQNTEANGIENGKSLFQAALSKTTDAAGGKPVWITETGWPVSGSNQGSAVPSLDNAKTYWDEVGCPLFGATNTWWFTLQDTAPVTPNPSFGIVGSTLSNTPLFDLSCSDLTSSSTSSAPTSASSTSSATSAVESSASSEATGGAGLSPTQGAGNGVGPVDTTAVGPAPDATTVVVAPTGGNLSTSAQPTTVTTATTVVPGTGGSQTTPSGPATVTENAASAVSNSFVGALGGAMGGLFFAIMAL